VAGEVRLAQEEQSGDAALAGELAPDRVADGAEAQLLDHLAEERVEDRARAQGLGIAAVSVNHPFGSGGNEAHGA
jgi:hypothetical protein